LDLVILEVFSNLSFYDSIILPEIHPGSQMITKDHNQQESRILFPLTIS